MPEFQTLLFATDFSTCSDQTLTHAVTLAEQFDAELHILHAVVVPGGEPLDDRQPSDEEKAWIERLDEETRERLRAVAVRAEASPAAFRLVRRVGFRPGPVILDYAEEIAADLIVLGTHGRRGPGRWFLGSTAEEVLRHSTRGVLTVRELEGADAREPAYGRVLVPVDFTGASVKTAGVAKSLADVLEARITLFHVIDIPTVPAEYGEPPVADLAQIETRVRVELHKLGRSVGLGEEDFDVAAEVGSAPAGIVDYAALNESDLIVMPARSGRPTGLLGGTTNRVVRRATCPVLTLPPA